jgi:two-component system sensor histidine kinase KdpD
MIIRDVTILKRLDDVRFQMLSEAAGKLQLPLAQAISNMAELNSLVGDKDPRAADILYRQTGVWDRIQHWLFDLLQLMRIESGMDLRPVEVDLAAALPEIVRAAPDRALRERRVKVALALAPDLPRLRIDPSLLRQLVTGLLRWAGGRSPVDGTVQLRLAVRSGQLGIEVTDTGPALAEADVARLFEKAVGSGGAGSGLELALVKSIADRMGGQVWARRQDNGGSVAVYLPVPVETPAAGDFV